MNRLWIAAFAFSVLVVLNGTGETATKGRAMNYKVKRLRGSLTVDSNWDKAVWKDVEPLVINLHMGERPEHFPKAEAKVLYDDENVYVIFRVEDRYVRAIATEYHGRVWEDSCVEFFFTPGIDESLGYFNLETNCGGTQLLHYSRMQQKGSNRIDIELMKQIEVAGTMPKVVEPEITDPVTWTMEYRLPLSIVDKYCAMERPGPGVIWRANFYKCGDETSHPHWLTWSPIDLPEPSFHQPKFFGTLEFME
ncbi:carbohydrate-binding family 9-like protein [candidate division KSB1 bacterium]